MGGGIVPIVVVWLQMDEVREAVAHSTGRARAGGFHGYAAHWYLLNQVLSPLSKTAMHEAHKAARLL